MKGQQEEYGEMVEIDVLPRPPQHYYQYDQPNSPHHNPYQHPDSDTSSSYRRRSPQELMSPSRPHRVPSDDYGSPGWPSPVASRPNSQLYLGEYGYDSRPSTPPQLRSPRPGAPFMHTNSSSFDSRPNFDSRPQTPMNQSHLSLAGLLPNGPAPMLDKDWVKPGTIARLHDRDDADIWKGWRRNFFKFTPFLTFFNMALYLLYLGLRIFCVISAQATYGTTYAAAWIFIAVEIAVAIPSMMHNFWTMWALKKRRRAKLRLTGYDVPTVDVFITCCGEDDDVILDTVRAACDIDYPRDRFRVLLLDDAKSKSLEEAVNNLSVSMYHNLYYLARTKIPGQPHHFKAGNLNYGLEQTHLLPGGAGQYMAALDADMIPEKDWLRAVLPHLMADPKMALACPPQLFYNTPPSDPLAQSLDFFVHVIEPIKDALGVAWCTGSGYVVRREALDEIGNFPLGSLAEDVATSTMMLGKGWKTAYIHEPLQFGTVPDDYASHLKQRTRWAIGTVDTAFKLNFCLWGDKVRQMTFAQRFSGFLYASLSLYTLLLTISLFAIPIILVMGKPLVAYANDDQLRWLIWACFAATMANRLCEFALFIPAGYHTGQRGSRYQLWMSPYIALCIVRAFILPKWLGGQAQAFKPTGSLDSKLNERDAVRRKNMLRRLWAILVNCMASFHLAFVYLTLVAVVITSYRCFFTQTGARNIITCLLTHAFWPPLTFLFIVSSLWTPISYAIDPPDVPEREQLLDRDSKTHVAHPTRKSKKIAFAGQAAWFEFEYTFATAYTILIFVVSFIF
ncbi:uncharacterized protein E0L32_001703 [Thyridium curvatum]|uniref:Glycosyltransferase 2-like domain-containing protein n=1 Tax=Thyridium curvatum TaxID=1093900 RepID=A0A507ANB9_9PEZI|nr:uncharacterized protein E0L32_001496 [Thyridium curvatum]XP_030990954.1 uncharacterized protein E0L32_001703 [Thyridium curvatum]TPX09036.1 hypothetical protein E0L32_001496 [Thyridium curvatum]TPX09243.1 hypothetical protein E0L32_001703 [Thyridium curvatum]